MIKLYHAKLHTANGKPVFLAAEIDLTIREILRAVMRRHRIPCIFTEVMPTHVHLILIDFAGHGHRKVIASGQGRIGARVPGA